MRARWLPSLLGLGLALATHLPAGAEVLWRARSAKPCRLELELGPASIEVVRRRGSARLSGDGARWKIVADSSGKSLKLEVESAGEEVPPPAGTFPLLLELPPACDLRLHAGAGRIVHRGPIRGPLEAATTTGEIQLCAADGADLGLFLATSGEITVDFSVSIDYGHHQEPAKRGSITLGSGAFQAHLMSRQGAIRALRCSERATPRQDS